MIKLWKRIPRGWKIALDCIAVLILLVILWAVLDYPMPTAKMAFRRAVSGAGFSARDPELILELESDEVENGRLETTNRTLGLLADGDHALRVSLSKELGWGVSKLLCVPTAEGVYYTPLPGWGDYNCVISYDNVDKFFSAAKGPTEKKAPIDIRIPAFAVKAPGADATLTLILEDYRELDGTVKSGGRFPLLFQQKESGWFIFRWDSLDIINHLREEAAYNGGFTEDRYWVLYNWMRNYDIENELNGVNAQLELTTRDETGKELNRVTWKLP